MCTWFVYKYILYIAWTLLSVYCSIAWYHGTSIVNDYLRYPINTSWLSSKTTDFSFSTLKPPDLTICNLNPISSYYAQRAGYSESILSISRYVEIVRQYDDYPKLHSDLAVSDILLTIFGYYQNIGQNSSTILGHEKNNLILSCYTELFDGFASQFVPCERLVTITQTSYPALFNCYTVHESVTEEKYSGGGAVGGYEMVLHFDNYDVANLSLLSSNYNRDYVGVLIIPHKRGTKGSLDGENTIFIHPGCYVDLKMKVRHTHRLGPPYGEECPESEKLRYNENWRYTKSSCLSACVQRELLKVRNILLYLQGLLYLTRYFQRCRLFRQDLYMNLRIHYTYILSGLENDGTKPCCVLPSIVYVDGLWS